MDIKQLQSMGALVTRTLSKREVAVKYPSDPENPDSERVEGSVTVWIRKRSSADFLEMVNAPDRDKAHIAILRCICQEDGSEVFESLDQAKQLAEWMFVPLMLAVNEVNSFGLKNSQPRMSSGTKSLPSSSAVRSRKLKRGSVKKNGPNGLPTGPSAAP